MPFAGAPAKSTWGRHTALLAYSDILMGSERDELRLRGAAPVPGL